MKGGIADAGKDVGEEGGGRAGAEELRGARDDGFICLDFGLGAGAVDILAVEAAGPVGEVGGAAHALLVGEVVDG